APGGEMKVELEKAEHCWNTLLPILEKLDESHQANPEELSELAKEADITMEIYSAILEMLLKEAETV
ncbi:MAG: hypothetical protein AAFZ09_02235, partial [Pseudomonadota bacterium]